MILKQSFAQPIDFGLLTAAVRRSATVFLLLLLTGGAGCASSGTLQPHHAFRQATTPYQGYYQGQQSFFGAASGLGVPASDNYAPYSAYNNSLPGYGQPNPATGSYGAFGNQFATPTGNSIGGQAPAQGAYPPFYPNAGYNYQRAYTGGFTSGSC